MPSDLQMNAAVDEVREDAKTHVNLHGASTWLYNLHVLWLSRTLLMRVTGIAFVVSLVVAFIIPKMYVSEARIMPPEMYAAGFQPCSKPFRACAIPTWNTARSIRCIVS